MIFIADYTFLTRTGLMSLLIDNGLDTNVLVSAGEESLKQELYGLQPDLVITDPHSFKNSGSSVFSPLREICQQNNVLVISHNEDNARIKRWWQQGIKGFVSKQSSEDKILTAIKAVMDGKNYYDAQLMDQLFKGDIQRSVLIEELSHREREVLGKIAKGLSSNQIAEELFLSIHTINSHRKNMLRKLGLKSPAQLVVFAIENGLLEV